MIRFARRNLLLFFRDKAAVFFSLLAVFIIIGLYALFLGDVWTSSFDEIAEAKVLMSNWIIAGLLAVTSATTTMGAFGILIDDKTKKIEKDFIASPLPQSARMGGYVISSFVIGVIMSVITLVLGELYILSAGGTLLPFGALCKVLALILLATFTNTALILLLVSFFRSNNAFSTASTIIGTLIGFLTGIYLPIGELPEAVQYVVKCFPPSHAAMLLRQAFLGDAVTEAFRDIPAEAYTPKQFNTLMGNVFYFGETEVTPLISVCVLLGCALVCYLLAFLRFRSKRK